MTKQLEIGDGSDWRFVNGDWIDGEDGQVCVPENLLRQDGPAMQDMHWAFSKSLVCRDFTARFEIKLYPHSDQGIIFRARDESHFYVLHFPNCGQACRAQHFWVALSVMDDTGWLRHTKLEMVRRVPSQTGIWLPVEVTVRGSRILAKIGDYGVFEAEDCTYSGPGSVGLYSCSAYVPAGMRNAVVEAEDGTVAAGVDSKSHLVPRRTDAATIWREDLHQPANWFHPLPTKDKVWQHPIDVKRFPDGELLLLVGTQTQVSMHEDARSEQLLTRSLDGGRTWSAPEPFNLGGFGHAWSPSRIHITPKGRLIAVIGGTDHKLVRESTDRGRTWSDPVKVNLHVGPPQEKPTQQIAPQGFLNLEDGGMLAFMLIGHPLKDPALNVWTWGSLHCQAFTSRSDDDGLTWSAPVNMDTPGFDADGKPYEGNLDLTEASAVQLADGRVTAFVRPIYSPWMWETWSDDGGRSWGPCVRGPFPGYSAPNMVRTESGAMLIAHRLPFLCVNCSLDEGRTWDSVTIDSGCSATGTMVEVEPDLVLYMYFDTNQTLMRSQFLRVTPKGLRPLAASNASGARCERPERVV